MVKLSYVAESQTEDQRVRQAAIAVLTTFPHNSEYWQRLALISRKESNSTVSSFIKAVLLGQANDMDMTHSNW